MATASTEAAGAVLQNTLSGEAQAVLQNTPLGMAQQSCPLGELTPTTCGIGTWTLRVVQTRVIEYTYTWQGQQRQGKKAEYILLSEDSNSYCMGIVKRTGTAATADQTFKATMEKFKEGTIWNMSRITLASEKTQFVGSPVKYVIDLTKTKVSPVLQSTTFPNTPTPAESLATIVQLPRQQKVDFVTLVRAVEKQRTATTSRGDRTIVDVTFMDGSKLANGKMATITTAMFFEKTKAGDAALQKLREHDKPIVVFGALCTPDAGKVNISMGHEAYWLSCHSGAKAERLMALAQEFRDQQDVEEIATQRNWTPQEARDFKAEPATQTTCAILHTILSQEDSMMETLFQLNHVRISEPGCGENIKTKDGARLFVPVRLLDFTGAVNLRMRQQAALELSGYSSVDEFDIACREACLRFPLLSSVRVLVRSKSRGASEHAALSQNDAAEVSAVVVEATTQLWDAKCAPNRAVLELSALLPQLPTPSSRMVAARVRDITVAPHAGMVVKMGNVTIVADYVLVLIAAKERSGGKQFGTGYRVLTKNVVDCDIWDSGSDVPVTADCVSICTMDNLMHYKMAPPKPGSVQYALALVSGFTAATDSTTGSLMIDYVESIASDNIEDYKKALRKLATLAQGATFATSPAKRLSWSPTRTPFNAKRARKLAHSPTDASLPDIAPTTPQ